MILGLLPLADWEALSLTDRAKLMAAAVRNGYTDIRSIKAAYANFKNQQQTGNRYVEGGDIDNNDVEIVNVLDEHPVWKALGNIDYETVADPEFTSEKTGAGSIEYFSAEEPEGITYNNGYHRDHPMPGKDVILYNPDENDELDIRLDALHIMPKDPTYDTLNSLYREAARDSDVAWAAEQRYKEDVAKYGKEALDKAGMTPLTYFNNEADGFLRNMFIEGTPEYIESRRYYPNKQQLAEWNSHLMPYVNNIQQYLETGQRPDWLLPELTVTNQNAYGGNLFQTGGNKSKKRGITQQELQRRRDYYRQQLIIRGLRGAQLDAVLANMEVESTLDPGAHNDASGARGLMQWLGSRKPKSWSEKDQLDYIAATYNKFGGNEWLDKKAWKRFNETTDPAEAARLFRRYWERPERSSWNATDKLFKNSKGSYLPQEVNDLVAQVSNLQYDEPKAPVFTEEDQRLLDTPAMAFYNPEYEDTQAPDYKPSALQEAIKLDESLWNNPANNWALYNQFANMQQGSSQDDPLGWMTTMASLSPNTTPEQKEAASTMYQLFAPQDGDYSYHGLNFAAYGGKVNRFDGYGDSHLNAVRSSNPRRDGYYIADGAGTRREITYEQALELAKNNPNLVVNYYKNNVGGTGRLHWDENQNRFVDNNEYFGKELDNVDVVKFVNRPTRQLTDAIPIGTPVLEYRPDITPYVDFTNTDQNMFHRRRVANADAAVREALSSDVVDHVYDYMMPSTWAGTADKLFDRDENGNFKYNFFTDFNKIFNPTYDNQGWVGLFGADLWAKDHPEGAFAINFGADLLFPYGIKGAKTAANAAYKTGMEYRLANKLNKSIRLGIRPQWSDNMMYRRALLQEADDLMYSGRYRELPEGQTVPQNLNSDGAIKRRLKNRERLRNGDFTIPEMHKSRGNSHGGKSFAKGQPWQGTTSSGSTSSELILETPGQDMQVGHHGSYTDVMPFSDIETGAGLWRKFGETGETGIPAEGTTIYRPKPDGTYEVETITGNEPGHFRFRLGDVEINNPLLAYRLARPGTAQNFLDTGYAFTPEETANIIAEEEGLFTPTLRQRAGIDPGYSLAYPMYSQGSLWYGTPAEGTSIPDLIVTARSLRPANSKSYPIRSYSKAQGRRMSEVVGEITPDNASAYTYVPNYGYKKLGTLNPIKTIPNSNILSIDENTLLDRFKNIQGGNKKYGVTGIYAPRTNNIFNRLITKLGFADGGHLFYGGGFEDLFNNTYLGIGQFPDYDADFIATNNLQYLPYSQLNMMGRDPENIRIGNQGNQTMYAYDDKDATYLADANGNLVTSPLLRQMTQDYVKAHYGPMLQKAFLGDPDKYWDEYNRYRTNAITFDENGNPIGSSGLPPIEKPIEPVAPEFWLLSAGASKAPSTLNSVVSPLFNMAAVDNVIDDVTPYSSWGNMMSQNAGGPEWAWDLVHPSFTGGLFTNAAKKALTAGADAASKATRNAVASAAINYGAKTRTLPTNIYKSKMAFKGPDNKFVWDSDPFVEFINTKRGIPENTSFFFRMPKDANILNARNGAYRAKGSYYGPIISGGTVDGKFVSYGEPWMEFGTGPNSSWYEFPTSMNRGGRGPYMMATDWRGNKMDYDVTEAWRSMMLTQNPEFVAEEKAIDEALSSQKFNNTRERVQAYKEARTPFYEKWEYNPDIRTDIYAGNQTVIPNKLWHFNSEPGNRGFLSQPFWRYTADPYSGAVQKELMMNWPSSSVLSVSNKDILPISNNSLLDRLSEQWDWNRDIALFRGDALELLRLRDLHFKSAAPNNKYIKSSGMPEEGTHGTNNNFYSFELEGPGIKHGDPGDYGYGHYFYPGNTTSTYGDRQIHAYLNIERPYTGEWNRGFNRGLAGLSQTLKNMRSAREFGLTNLTPEEMIEELNKLKISDGVLAMSPYSGRIQEIVVPTGNLIKLVNPLTFDNNGNLIPLSSRDNFNINDIRFSTGGIMHLK